MSFLKIQELSGPGHFWRAKDPKEAIRVVFKLKLSDVIRKYTILHYIKLIHNMTV